jgi:hypothetical protein
MSEVEDDELLEALGVEAAAETTSQHSPREERLIAGFEDILRFAATHGRAPSHGEDRDIFERLYAVRLDRLRALPEARALLAPLDPTGLLADRPGLAAVADGLDDSTLLAELGVGDRGEMEPTDISVLRHVPSFDERRAAEEVANRTRCLDFDSFKPLFERAEKELRSGVRQTRPFQRDAKVKDGDIFVLGGQMVYVASVGSLTRAPNGSTDARLRVIYANGTESDLLMRSLQRALHKDETGRRLTEPSNGPLFGSELSDEDVVSGTIYVLRSASDHPYVAEHRELIHKIGVTSGNVETRIGNARLDPTYLMADVDVVASYAIANLNSIKIENLVHRLFASVQIDLTIEDRFGHHVRPREWFLVPLHVIDEAVSRIRDGSIMDYEYNAQQASLARIMNS